MLLGGGKLEGRTGTGPSGTARLKRGSGSPHPHAAAGRRILCKPCPLSSANWAPTSSAKRAPSHPSQGCPSSRDGQTPCILREAGRQSNTRGPPEMTERFIMMKEERESTTLPSNMVFQAALAKFSASFSSARRHGASPNLYHAAGRTRRLPAFNDAEFN